MVAAVEFALHGPPLPLLHCPASLLLSYCPYSTDLETYLRSAFVQSHLHWLFQLNWEPEQVRLKQGSYSPLPALGTGTTGKKKKRQTVGTGIFNCFVLFFVTVATKPNKTPLDHITDDLTNLN